MPSLPDDLVKGLEAFTVARFEAGQQREVPYRCSALAACPRQLIRMAQGVPRLHVGAQSARVMDMGTVRHSVIQQELRELYRQADWSTQHELPVMIPLPIADQRTSERIYARLAPRWTRSIEQGAMSFNRVHTVDGAPTFSFVSIRARCDFVATKGGSAHIFEIKTVGSFPFRALEKGGDPHPHHLIQLYGQILGFRQQMGLRVDRAYLLYENRDTGARLLKLVEWDTPEARADLRLHLEAFVDGLTAFADRRYDDPPALYAEGIEQGPLPWQCNYCPVGPEVGDCVPASRLVMSEDASGKRKWRVTPDDRSDELQE